MRRNIILATFIFCVVPMLASAQAANNNQSTVFPPTGCKTNTLSVMGTTNKGNGEYAAVECLDGTEVLNLAVPDCKAGQIVVKKDDGGFECQDANKPSACREGQALAYTTAGFSCVDVKPPMPTCTAGQFLTYDGVQFACSQAAQKITFNCPDGQVLTGIKNGEPVCKEIANDTSSPNWQKPILYNASNHGNRIVNMGAHKVCMLSIAGVEISGRCVVSRNNDGTWTLDQASSNNSWYMWCSAYCFD